MTEAWEALIISIGSEIEHKTKDDNYPLDYEELLSLIHDLESEIRKLNSKNS